MKEIEDLLEKYPQSHLGFEATVGGGTPILHTLQTYYNTDEVQVLRGIINGSTNFILSKMLLLDIAYETVYDEAMKLGYLEANPDFDIRGMDAQSKLIILNRLAFGIQNNSKEIPMEGIQSVTLSDVQYFKKKGYHIKLVGTTQKDKDDRISSAILLCAVSIRNPLASVHYADNIIQLESENMNSVSILGSGAGRYPTANSVITDILYISSHQYENHSMMKEVNSCEVNHDFNGHFIIRLDSISIEELIKRSEGKVEFIQQFDNYYEIQSSIRELQRLRSLLVKNEKEFLILYKVE